MGPTRRFSIGSSGRSISRTQSLSASLSIPGKLSILPILFGVRGRKLLMDRCIRFVQTDMGNAGAKLVGMKEAPVTTKDSVAGVVAQVCLFLSLREKEV